MSQQNSFSLTGHFEDTGSIIRVLSAVLTQLIDVNQKSNNRTHFVTKFQSSYAPNITIQAYLERINKYAKCSPNCFIVALIYIDRLIEIRDIVLTSLNVHRILITSILLSTKVFDDEFYKNAYYAKLGGVSTSEMNTLEVEFLSLVNFNLYVSTETFDKYQQELLGFLGVSSVTNLTPKHGPQVSVPENERTQDVDPNSISPLRPLDVNNITALRSLLFNSSAQYPTAIPSNCSNSLFAHEDPLTTCPPQPSWPTSMFSNALPSHESPRSLTSYPSSDPSPTLSSVAVGSCPPHNFFQSACVHPANPGNMRDSELFSHPMAPPQSAYPFPNPNMPVTQSTDPHFHMHQNTVPLQKYASRQQRMSHNSTSPATQQNNGRVPPPYQNRYPQHSYEFGANNLQHYDPNGSFAPAMAYHPNGSAYFQHQNTSLPFCPVPTKNYGGNQNHFSGPYPPQQMQFMGGYYYQSIPSQMVPGSRYFAPCTTPNSVADIFCPLKNEFTPSRQFQSDDFTHRPHLQPISRSNSGYGPNLGVQHHYYSWGEQQDHMSCSTGTGPRFHNFSGIPADVNSYPATTLFYPVPLPTVS